MNADTLSFFRRHWPLLLALLVGLVWRVWLWDRLPRNGLIGDEAEYLAAADWLALGRGFSWHLGWLWTRAPLYPLFLAAHFALFGSSLTPIFMSQIALSLLNVALVYGLALLLEHRTENTERSDRRVGGVAALLMALYLPFASYTQLVLSETLFLSLLLAGFVALARWEERRVQNPEPRTQNPEPRTQNPEPRTQNPEPRTQNPEPRARSATICN
jgi:4-amino-4-deoxy-L-arabinose transferase-like glycosyltransferase